MGTKPNWGRFASSIGQSMMGYAEMKRREKELADRQAREERLYNERTQSNRTWQQEQTAAALKENRAWRDETNPSVDGKLPRYGGVLGVDFGAMNENSRVLQGIDQLKLLGGDPRQDFAQTLILQEGRRSDGSGAGSRSQKPPEFDRLSESTMLGGVVNPEEEYLWGDTLEPRVVEEAMSLLRMQNQDGSQRFTKDEAIELAADRVQATLTGDELYAGGLEYDLKTNSMYDPNFFEPESGVRRFLPDKDPSLRVLDGLSEKAKAEAGLPKNQPVTLSEFVDAHMKGALKRKSVNTGQLKEWAKSAGVPDEKFLEAWEIQAKGNEVVRVIREVELGGVMYNEVELANGTTTLQEK